MRPFANERVNLKTKQQQIRNITKDNDKHKKRIIKDRHTDRNANPHIGITVANFFPK